MKRIVTATLITASVLAPVGQLGLAPTARADVVAVSLPVSTAITTKMISLVGTVRVGSSGTGLRSASLWFTYPGDVMPTLVGSASSRRPGFLAITARIDASRIIPGPNELQVIDDADGGERTIKVDLRRQSRVSITRAEVRADGRMAISIQVHHFDPKLGRFAPSQLSPVHLQENVAGVWVTRANVVTNLAGLTGAVLPAGPGLHYYRAVRPDGATVRAATSATVTAGRPVVTIAGPGRSS